MKIVFFALIYLLCTSTISAQQPTWYRISYYKVLPTKERELRDLMHSVDAKVQQERANHNAILSWHLYEVLNPVGMNAEYDYVSITATSRFDEIYEPSYSFDSAFQKVLPRQPAEYFADYHHKMKDGFRLVKEEIYSGLSLADSSSSDGFQSRYLVVDYMQPKPDKANEYYKMEVDTFRLIHKERIKLGALQQWALLNYVFPWNTKKDYSFIVFNFQKEFDVTKDNKYAEATKNIFPASSIGDLFRNAATTNENIKADILRLVTFAVRVKK